MWCSEAWERSDLAERNPRRSSAEAYTILLDEVKPATKRPPWTVGVLFFFLLFFQYHYMLQYHFF